MRVAVNGKQFRVGETLRAHIESSVERIAEKYFGNPLDASVTVTREGAAVRADISVHVGKRIRIQGHGRAAEPYAAFDAANDRIDKRLRRFKRRLRDHHHRETEPDSLDAREAVLAAEAEAGADAPAEAAGADADDREEWRPVVVAEMTTQIETLTVEEAVMRMDLADAPTLMFRNSAHGGLNVVFRRADGNIGWVDPRGAAQD